MSSTSRHGSASRRTGRRAGCPDFAEILRQTSPDATIRDQVAECFYGELRAMAEARCKDASLAEDAAHDAVEKSLVALVDYRGDGPVECWLRRLVHSACSRIRAGRKNSPAWNRPMEELPPHQEEDPKQADLELRLVVNERVEALRAVLAQVPDPNRSLLLLHEAEEIPLSELAQRFNMTVDAVKARLMRTRILVREKLLSASEQGTSGSCGARS